MDIVSKYAPNIDENGRVVESFDDYRDRILKTLPNFPVDVFSQMLFDHPHDVDK